MKDQLLEMSVFERYRPDYLNDDEYRGLQMMLLENPSVGVLIPGLGGLRKARYAAKGKGKRGGVRVIYYYHATGRQFWLFTIYAKGELEDMTPMQKQAFCKALAAEKRARALL